MNLAPEHQKDFAAMPAALRELLEAELAAGNEIVESGHSFPAPPAGAYFKLARPVTTRPRKSGRGLDFYARNSSSYSGEFTDAKRFFFILEPPLPPPPEPDMNAIRAALEARPQAADAGLSAAKLHAKPRSRKKSGETGRSLVPPRPAPEVPARTRTTLALFRESMVMNYERWHDGIGYDLGLLKKATPEELMEIENLLVSRGVDDWRDVQALAALDSPRARVLLKQTLKTGKPELRVAVMDYAPHLVSDAERVAALIAALESTQIFGGLTQTLLQVQSYHPPQIVEALLRGVLARPGETAAHFAAMLMFIHGKAKTSFDWEQRPFFLKFNTDDRAERERLFCELCEKTGVSAETYLPASPK